MTYIITEPCVGTCDTACVDVCPVDCIHGPLDPKGMGTEVPELEKEGKLAGHQLYIQPSECIDCGACVPECPVEAIYADDEVPEEMQAYIKKNYEFFGEPAPG